MQDRAGEPRYRGERFAALKDILGITQGELGERLDVTQAFISRIIRLDRPVPESLAVKAATEYAVPLSFFSVAPSPGENAVPTFRKSSTATASAEKRVIQLHREASRLWYHLSTLSNYRDVQEVVAVESEDVEVVASGLRTIAGIDPGAPIPNVTRFIERLGIGVVAVLDPQYPVGKDGRRQHTGISTPTSRNQRPLISLVGDVPGGVQRMTLAHELGHLLFDADREARIVSIRSAEERRAYAFAGALLMPEEEMKGSINARSMLRDFGNVAARFGVSVPAVVQRAKVLGIIDDSRNQSLNIQINTAGWRKKDPVHVKPERPILMGQAATKIWPTASVMQAAEHAGVASGWARLWLGMEDRSEDEIPKNVVSLDSWRRRNVG